MRLRVRLRLHDLSLLALLRLAWLVAFLLLEHGIFLLATNACTWPLAVRRECQVALIADPQLVDENTYERRGIGMWLTKAMTDRYMRRNYRYLQWHGPGMVIFLGDLMDGGREWEDEKYPNPQCSFCSFLLNISVLFLVWERLMNEVGTRVCPFLARVPSQ